MSNCLLKDWLKEMKAWGQKWSRQWTPFAEPGCSEKQWIHIKQSTLFICEVWPKFARFPRGAPCLAQDAAQVWKVLPAFAGSDFAVNSRGAWRIMCSRVIQHLAPSKVSRIQRASIPPRGYWECMNSQWFCGIQQTSIIVRLRIAKRPWYAWPYHYLIMRLFSWIRSW